MEYERTSKLKSTTDKLSQEKTKGKRVNPPSSPYYQGNPSQVIFLRNPVLPGLMLPPALRGCVRGGQKCM